MHSEITKKSIHRVDGNINNNVVTCCRMIKFDLITFFIQTLNISLYPIRDRISYNSFLGAPRSRKEHSYQGLLALQFQRSKNESPYFGYRQVNALTGLNWLKQILQVLLSVTQQGDRLLTPHSELGTSLIRQPSLHRTLLLSLAAESATPQLQRGQAVELPDVACLWKTRGQHLGWT